MDSCRSLICILGVLFTGGLASEYFDASVGESLLFFRFLSFSVVFFVCVSYGFDEGEGYAYDFV